MKQILFLIALGFFFGKVFAIEDDVEIGVELQSFFQTPKYSAQHHQYPSVFINYDFSHDAGDDSLKGRLFYRNDAKATGRTHFDIRELMWSHYADDWEVNMGIGKVFWGVAESRHLVDVVNQIDSIEAIDDEQRLGQAMIFGRSIKSWGTTDLLLLPHFRERDFATQDERSRSQLIVDDSQSIYQNSKKDKHLDFALRFSHSIDDWDFAIHYFQGTQREPLLQSASSNNVVTLRPVYVQTRQTGLEAQYIVGDLLLKFEGLYRDSHQVDFQSFHSKASVFGFEYTLVGIFDSVYDLGIIGEYLYDSWHDITVFQKDIMAGLRLTLNDAFDSEILIGYISDVVDQSQLWNLEASRRLGESWKLTLTARMVNQVADENIVHALKEDDFVNLKLSYYF